jgi:hypothetical protein
MKNQQAEKVRNLEKGDEVVIDIKENIDAEVIDITDTKSNLRGDGYYRNGILIRRKVTFDTKYGEIHTICSWWPNHEPEDLEMVCGIQIPEYKELDGLSHKTHPLKFIYQ